MAKKHSSEAFYARDAPLEAALPSIMIIDDPHLLQQLVQEPLFERLQGFLKPEVSQKVQWLFFAMPFEEPR